MQVILDTSAADKALSSLGKKADRIIVQALNRSMRGVQTVLKRAVSKDMGMKVGSVAKRMAIGKATRSRQQATLRVNDKRVPLMEFKAKQTRKGVTHRIGGQRRQVPGAFIAEMPSGHKGVFKRRSRRRLPIVELHGPSIYKIAQRHLQVAKARAVKQLGDEIRSGIRRAVGG